MVVVVLGEWWFGSRDPVGGELQDRAVARPMSVWVEVKVVVGV